jgi:hypothetical protein
MMTKLLDFQTKYNLKRKSHIDQKIHILSTACYALWPMFHFSNIGTFQSTYVAAWDKEWWGTHLKCKNTFTPYQTTVRALFVAKPRN